MDGMNTMEFIRAEVLMYNGTTMPGVVPCEFLETVDSEQDRHVIEQNKRVLEVAQQVTSAYALGDAQQARANELNQQLSALVDTGIARFATGEIELSDENWAAWLSELRAAGSEELVVLFDEVK